MTREPSSERGVSEVIGSILVFGLVVMLLTIVQTQAVPSTNEDIEFQHSQQVQGDFARLSDAVDRAAVRGSSETVTLETGTTYPNRLVLFNPPPASGQLRVGEEATLLVRNVGASDPEVREYVGGQLGVGNMPSLGTARLTYEPNYNRYGSAPVTGSEYGVVYDAHPDETLVERAPPIVDGKEIDLRLLSGDYTESGLTTTVRTRPVSAGGSGIAVHGASDFPGTPSGNPMRVFLPTDLPESVWTQELLVGAIDDPDGGAAGAAPEPGDTCVDWDGSFPVPTAGGFAGVSPDPNNDRHVTNCYYLESSSGPNYVGLEFELDTEYTLRMSKVGFDSSTDLGPQYVVPTEPRASVGDAGAREVSVQVRDRYNNPVSGVELTADLSTAGNAPATTLETATESGTTVTTTTDADGVATVEVDTGSAFASGEVTFSGTFDGVSDPDQQEASVFVSASRSPPVTLRDVALTADDTVTLTLQNEGPERTVADVQVGDVHVVDRKTALTSSSGDADGSATVGGISFLVTDVVNELDGPERVDGVYVAEVDGSGTFVDLAAPAVEGEAPQSTDADALDSLPATTSRDVALRLDRTVPAFDTGDALVLEVTLTYDDGHSETYDVRLESDDDER
jgi:hypothetical protein